MSVDAFHPIFGGDKTKDESRDGGWWQCILGGHFWPGIGQNSSQWRTQPEHRRRVIEKVKSRDEQNHDSMAVPSRANIKAASHAILLWSPACIGAVFHRLPCLEHGRKDRDNIIISHQPPSYALQSSNYRVIVIMHYGNLPQWQNSRHCRDGTHTTSIRRHHLTGWLESRVIISIIP